MERPISEANRMGIEVQAPDINESNREFSIKDTSILFGFSAIKNLGLNAIDALIVNTIPGQGVKTVRTEEAICATLAVINIIK